MVPSDDTWMITDEDEVRLGGRGTSDREQSPRRRRNENFGDSLKKKSKVERQNFLSTQREERDRDTYNSKDMNDTVFFQSID